MSGCGWGPCETLRMFWLIFRTRASRAARVPQVMRLRLGIIQVPAQKVCTSRRKSIQMRSRSLSPAQEFHLCIGLGASSAFQTSIPVEMTGALCDAFLAPHKASRALYIQLLSCPGTQSCLSTTDPSTAA